MKRVKILMIFLFKIETQEAKILLIAVTNNNIINNKIISSKLKSLINSKTILMFKMIRKFNIIITIVNTIIIVSIAIVKGSFIGLIKLRQIHLFFQQGKANYQMKYKRMADKMIAKLLIVQ